MRASWINPIIQPPVPVASTTKPAPRKQAPREEARRKMTRREVTEYMRSCKKKHEPSERRRAQIVEALRKAGADGLTYQQIVEEIGESMRNTFNALCTLNDAGVISRRVVGHGGHRPLYESRLGDRYITKRGPATRPCAIWWLKEFV